MTSFCRPSGADWCLLTQSQGLPPWARIWRASGAVNARRKQSHERIGDMTSRPGMFTPSSGTGAERAEELRRRYPRFVYERFAAERTGDALRVKFHFRAEPDLEFAPETVFPGVDWARVDALPEGTLENLLFHVGLIEMLSYWKATCSPEIRVEAGALDEEQTGWFLGLLRRGMGEYFYINAASVPLVLNEMYLSAQSHDSPFLFSQHDRPRDFYGAGLAISPRFTDSPGSTVTVASLGMEPSGVAGNESLYSQFGTSDFNSNCP